MGISGISGLKMHALGSIKINTVGLCLVLLLSRRALGCTGGGGGGGCSLNQTLGKLINLQRKNESTTDPAVHRRDAVIHVVDIMSTS